MNNTTPLGQINPQTNKPSIQNCINSDEFRVKDKITGNDFKLDVCFESANTRWSNWGREYLIQWAGNYCMLRPEPITHFGIIRS